MKALRYKWGMCLFQGRFSSKRPREIFVPSHATNCAVKVWYYWFNLEILNCHFATMSYVIGCTDAYFNVPLLFWRILYTETLELDTNGISKRHSYAFNCRNSFQPEASVYITIPGWRNKDFENVNTPSRFSFMTRVHFGRIWQNACFLPVSLL